MPRVVFSLICGRLEGSLLQLVLICQQLLPVDRQGMQLLPQLEACKRFVRLGAGVQLLQGPAHVVCYAFYMSHFSRQSGGQIIGKTGWPAGRQ